MQKTIITGSSKTIHRNNMFLLSLQIQISLITLKCWCQSQCKIGLVLRIIDPWPLFKIINLTINQILIKIISYTQDKLVIIINHTQIGFMVITNKGVNHNKLMRQIWEEMPIMKIMLLIKSNNTIRINNNKENNSTINNWESHNIIRIQESKPSNSLMIQHLMAITCYLPIIQLLPIWCNIQLCKTKTHSIMEQINFKDKLAKVYIHRIFSKLTTIIVRLNISSINSSLLNMTKYPIIIQFNNHKIGNIVNNNHFKTIL